MYRVIFFMEEEETISLLTSILPEEFQALGGYTVVNDVVEYAESDHVDVVVVDTAIRSEIGLELIRKLYQHRKHPEVLMLCDYREMEYARRAAELGVKYYLLKPVRLDEFTYAISSIKLELDRRNISRLQHISSLNFDQFLPVLREQFFTDLMSGEPLSKEELLGRLNQLKLDVDIYRFPCAVIEVHVLDYDRYLQSKWKYGTDALYTAIKNLLNDNGHFTYQLVESRQQLCRFVLIAKETLSQTEFQAALESRAAQDTASAFSLFGMMLLIRPVAIFANLVEFADQIRCNHEIDRLLRVRKGTSTDTDNVSKMVSLLRQTRVTDARRIAGRYIEELTTFPDKDVARFLFCMATIICEQLFPGNEEMYSRTVQMLHDTDSRSRLKENMMQLLGEYADAFGNNLYRSDEVVVQKAKQYIAEHCQEDISLDQVAENAFLTPVYFSRFFKEKTGENFSKFLTRTRMERAIELFRDGRYKIYEVAAMVGYKNAKYFSKLFREYTGFLPREYIYNVLGREKES